MELNQTCCSVWLYLSGKALCQTENPKSLHAKIVALHDYLFNNYYAIM